MLNYDREAKSLGFVPTTNLNHAQVLERSDLQEAIVRSWDAFCAEMGREELFLVGTEIRPHSSCDNRVDILAMSNDGRPVVFELKRHRNRLQLLQAISYAAMVSKWPKQRFLKELIGQSGEQAEELRGLLEEEEFELEGPEVVLVAESFDPEVILAADWLADFGVPISAFAISTVDHKGELLLAVDQKFPLLGLDDVYVGRGRATEDAEGRTTWSDVVAKLDFPFAGRAVEIFRRHVAGSPHRRAFFYIYGSSPLGRLGIHFRKDYLKVYTHDQSPAAREALAEHLGEVISFTPWGNENTKNKGFTFKVETEEQFQQMLRAVGESEPE
jgi:hypothetical protein